MSEEETLNALSNRVMCVRMYTDDICGVDPIVGSRRKLLSGDIKSTTTNIIVMFELDIPTADDSQPLLGDLESGELS